MHLPVPDEQSELSEIRRRDCAQSKFARIVRVADHEPNASGSSDSKVLLLLPTVGPRGRRDRNQNLPSWKSWSLEAFAPLCRRKDPFFSYTKIQAVSEMHSRPEDFRDGQDLCVVHPHVHPSFQNTCQLLQFFCPWVFSPMQDVHVQPSVATSLIACTQRNPHEIGEDRSLALR